MMIQLNKHDSIRGWFAYELYLQMLKDKDIMIVVGDLGYGMFDAIRRDFPDRFFNVGASEQAAAGICVGLAIEGKKPFFYSITTFGLYRAFETWRNYVDHYKVPVRMCFSGRDKDYHIDGFSHDSSDAKKILKTALPNIITLWPNKKEQIPSMVSKMVKENKPWFISLKR